MELLQIITDLEDLLSESNISDCLDQTTQSELDTIFHIIYGLIESTEF